MADSRQIHSLQHRVPCSRVRADLSGNFTGPCALASMKDKFSLIFMPLHCPARTLLFRRRTAASICQRCFESNKKEVKMTSYCLKAALGLVLSAAVGAASAASPQSSTGATVFDLSTGGTVTVNGALFIAPPNPEIVSGTGFWDPFVRIQASGGNNPNSTTGGCGQGSKQTCEQGYNTSDRLVQFDEKTDGNYTRDLKLSEVPIVTVGTIQYFEFLLDIAEPAADNTNQTKSLLSLDQLQLFAGADQATNTNAGDYSSTTGNGSLGGLNALYTLDLGQDNYIKLDYNLVGSGNGRADMIALIPVLNVPDAIRANGNNSVYLFSRFGDQLSTPTSPDMSAEGSFEEWAVRGTTSNGSGGGPGQIPEPGTLALVGAAALAGLFRYRRRALA